MLEYLVKKIRRLKPQKEGDFHAPERVVPYSAGRKVDRDAGPPGGESVQKPAVHPPTPVRRLLCPVCSVEMDRKILGSSEIDQCPRCAGIFLDKGELQEISGFDFSSYERASSGDEALIYTPHGLTGRLRGKN